MIAPVAFPIPRRRATAARALLLAAAVTVLGVLPMAAQAAGGAAASGQWLIERKRDGGDVELTFIWKPSPGHQHWGSRTTSLARLGTITDAELDGGPSDVHFELRRDAGTLVCDGRIGEGHGAGLFELRLDPTFAKGLSQRGVGTPSETQQIRLALADAGYAVPS